MLSSPSIFHLCFWQDSALSWCLTERISILTHEPRSRYGEISSLCLAASLGSLLFQIKGAALREIMLRRREQLSKLKLQSCTQGIFLKLCKGAMNLNPVKRQSCTQSSDDALLHISNILVLTDFTLLNTTTNVSKQHFGFLFYILFLLETHKFFPVYAADQIFCSMTKGIFLNAFYSRLVYAFL